MIVLDSSFLVAYHNLSDVHHEAAREIMGRLLDGEWGDALVPEYVFLEVVTVVAARRDLRTAVRVGETLLRAEEITLVPCSGLFRVAFAVFRDQPEARLSFTDAAIVALVRDSGTPHVATFDEDFRSVEEVVPVRP